MPFIKLMIFTFISAAIALAIQRSLGLPDWAIFPICGGMGFVGFLLVRRFTLMYVGEAGSIEYRNWERDMAEGLADSRPPFVRAINLFGFASFVAIPFLIAATLLR